MCDRKHLKHNDDPQWAELYPEGRVLYFEGEDLFGFIQQVKEKFGLDLSRSPNASFQFRCPPEHLQEMLNGDYPVGT
jgi:hypothetical protein